MSTFARLYADAYDALYAEKDYDGEATRVARSWARAGGRVRRVLDMGCGTGRHAAAFARRGYDVVGFDQSPDLIEIARARVPAARFEVADLRFFELGDFDAAVCMYATLGYLTATDDLVAALTRTRAHLSDGGLLAFDVWNAAAVYADPPKQQHRKLTVGGDVVVRTTTPELDRMRSLCHLRYELYRLAGRELIDRRVEEHVMRFFTANELALLLHVSGFDVVECDENGWYLVLLARAA